MGRTAAALVLCLLALAVAGCESGQQQESSSTEACEGSAALCARPLNDVFFAGTHNSFAAADEPGWHFANQTYPIPRQLQDGIRALLLDVHYGVHDAATGLIRTDLAAEGSDRNKVAQQLPAEALRVADRVAGGIGVSTPSGAPQPYLCHTLCELGAEPLDRELRAIASFLQAHPREVLVVIVEDYVPASTIEHAFAQAGLTRYVATLPAHAPLPTLGELTDSGHRLLVFAEEKGGSPAWYMPAFSLIQDTPLGAVQPGQLSCARARGEKDGPLLLLNHWIPPFPPSVRLNAAIGRASFLRSRIERCGRDRGVHGAIIAVDFYQRSAVVQVARELNERAGAGYGAK